VKLKRSHIHIGTGKTPILLSFQIPGGQFIADFTSRVAIQLKKDPKKFGLPGFYDVTLVAGETTESSI